MSIPNLRSMSRIATVTASLAMLVLLFSSSVGCIEIALLLQDALPPAGNLDGSVNLPPSEDDNPTDTNPTISPSVVLRVSNANPTVGEQLILTCDVESQAPIGTQFSFSDSSNRLIQSPFSSTASLIISESDVSVQFQFRCSASFPDGSNSDSSTISVIPSG